MTRFGWFKVLVRLGVGFAILLWLLRIADIVKVFSILRMVNPLSVVLASLFFIGASTFVALALYIPIKFIAGPAPMAKVVQGSFAGQLLSDVTPARSGYFATPLILKELCNVPVERGMAGVLALGIVNSFTKVILSVIALLYFVSFLSLSSMVINALLVGVLFLLGGGIFLYTTLRGKGFWKLIMVLEKIPVIKVLVHRLVAMLGKIQEGGTGILGQLTKMFPLILLSLTANAMALQSISWGLGFGSLNLVEFVFVAALVSSLMYIPVTIGGLGVQEIGYVLLLTSLGMPFETAVAFALLTRTLFTGTDIIGLPTLIRVGLKSKG
jgi:uncharacterized protein (TIRG00374 family)